MKMLLVNSVLDETEGVIQESTNQVVANAVKTLEIKYFSLHTIHNQKLVFINMNLPVTLKEIRLLHKNATEALGVFKPVLVFDKINTKRKKVLETEHISFSIKNGEIRVF